MTEPLLSTITTLTALSVPFRGDADALSLPTLLLIVPAAGSLLAMTMLTRHAAAAVSLATFVVQSIVLAIAARELVRFDDASSGVTGPSCANSASRDDASVVLAQCAEWFPQHGVEYHVVLGWGALGLIALTTLVTASASAFAWWADRERPAAFQGLLWMAAASLSMLFVARDLILFYVAFELMLVPLLLLVGIWGGAERIRATMTMFIYTLLGSLPMLVAVLAVGVAGNDAIGKLGDRGEGMSPFALPDLAALVASGDLRLSSWILAAFLLGFAIKAPLVPLHGWLPVAYRQAPAEVSAMLSGLVSKAAFFGLLVVVLPLFPEQMGGGWGTALTWVALAGLIFGSLSAFRQPDPRGVVAYSSLAQMGLIVLGLSAYVGAGSEQALSGAYLQTINHGLISAGLFLLVGIIEQRTGATTLAELGSLARGRARLLTVALTLTLVALAVPGASTFSGELLILTGVFRDGTNGPIVAAIGSIAVVLAAMYALRLVAAVAFTPNDTPPSARDRFGADLSARELLLVAPVLIVLLTLSAWPNLAHRAMTRPPVAIEQGEDPLEGVSTDAADHGADHEDAGE